MNPEMIATIIGVAFGLIGLLAAGYVVLRSGLAEKTAELWKNEAEAQKERGDRLESSFADLSLRVEHLESENKTLKELVTSSAAVSTLSARIEAQHREVMGALNARQRP